MPLVRRWFEWKSRKHQNSLTEDEVDLHGNVGISKFNCWSARRKVAIAVHAGNAGFVRIAVVATVKMLLSSWMSAMRKPHRSVAPSDEWPEWADNGRNRFSTPL